MLKELEDKLLTILRENLVEIPGENIVVDFKPEKLPAIIISNLDFKFENAALAEDIDEGKAQLEERFSSDGVKTSYGLKEKPLKNSVHVESPTDTLLAEKDDYTINYKDGAIDFRSAPKKGKNNVFVKYASKKSIMTLKSLKVKASYSIEVMGSDRAEADSLAEKVLKVLLTVEDDLLAEGIESKPVEGTVLVEEKGKIGKIQLKYMFERELRVEKPIELIEKIEITSKNL